jgi:hypothetical protein
MPEDKALKNSGPKSEEITGGKREIHNKELHNLHSSCNTIRVIKSRGISGTCSIHMRDEKCMPNFKQKTSWKEVNWETKA